ncbi:M6 family metalloprotease domain-containing protein [Herbaspirillum sp. SJZ107]|uniref:M6 family metalloprotease domain-containing protein n=1 Tax=Herbaspirillum sp. SJZ107 TaxID=2572881 RepID=UPI0011512E3B|nr:M6 family metalloprotease domain-containing protein [Herbaspirillum sp. SJZ107]TQK01271.1 immune inhibitor A [Herbaspirillum sp. SJZ107]
MCNEHGVFEDVSRIYAASRRAPDPQRCMVAPSPELDDRLRKELEVMKSTFSAGSLRLRATQPRQEGFDDGTIIPPEYFPLGTPPSVIRNQALERAPLSGTVRIIVVMVDFEDKPMKATKNDIHQLFFSSGVIATGSVHDYYAEVTNNKINLQGQVVGPFRLPHKLAYYANGHSGTGGALPNAQTMARDALNASNPSVNFAPYDNDGNGFVDAFVVVHAGSGGEVTGKVGDIWSHKWVFSEGAVTADGTKVYAYLTVPEDGRIGVCAHELGHLLFGFPDLYDVDGSSSGIGGHCLMASGSWGGGGATPTHPSAWCKANQGWVTVENVTSNGSRSIADVKDSHKVLRMWKDGGSGSEYFLVENRQQTRFDKSLPGAGLMIWHIDESVSSNANETRYKVALVQADNRKDLEGGKNRGDAGDVYPGTSNNTSFSNSSSPNSKSYAGQSTCVSVTSISAPGPVMTANVTVKCTPKLGKELMKDKELVLEKPVRDKVPEKPFADKLIEKPQIDKSLTYEKPTDKPADKPREGGLPGRLTSASPAGDAHIEARMAQLESVVGSLIGQPGAAAAQPFIAAQLRPDLSQGALAAEDENAQEAMQRGDAGAKRSFDTKLGDG